MKKILFLSFLAVFVGCGDPTGPIRKENSDRDKIADQIPASTDKQENINQPKNKQNNKEGVDDMVNKVSEYPQHSVGELLDLPVPGSNFTIGHILAQTSAYTRYYITYVSDGLTISGIMNVPKATETDPGPWPVLFLNHGYIDPAVYTNGRGLKREQDYFARHGYVVIHSDYRGHAQSDPNPISDDKVGESGYTRDILGGINAFKSLDPDFAHVNSIGMLGHSMGGGVTMRAAVARPEQIQAAVLYAPVSSDYLDNVKRWMLDRLDPSEAAKIQTADGQWDPELVAPFSAMTYFDRIQAPIMIHHGDRDKDVPIQWSKDTINRLNQAQGNHRKKPIYHEYPGEGHEFGPQWEKFMERSVTFFDEHLKK